MDEQTVTSSTGGQKGKKLARFDLIPPRPLWLLAEMYGKGAAKYADRNWELGTDWSLNYGALGRHLNLFWQGEDYDDHEPDCAPDCATHTELPHMVSVMWHAAALVEFMETHPELDDRPGTQMRESIASVMRAARAEAMSHHPSSGSVKAES